MKSFFVSIILMMLFILSACETTQTTSANHDRTSHSDEKVAAPSSSSKRERIQADVTLVAHGMSCPLCATNLDKQMLKIEGVKDVFVDLSTGQIIVDVDESKRPSDETLANAVLESGFTLVSVKSNSNQAGETR